MGVASGADRTSLGLTRPVLGATLTFCPYRREFGGSGVRRFHCLAVPAVMVWVGGTRAGGVVVGAQGLFAGCG